MIEILSGQNTSFFYNIENIILKLFEKYKKHFLLLLFFCKIHLTLKKEKLSATNFFIFFLCIRNWTFLIFRSFTLKTFINFVAIQNKKADDKEFFYEINSLESFFVVSSRVAHFFELSRLGARFNIVFILFYDFVSLVCIKGVKK